MSLNKLGLQACTRCTLCQSATQKVDGRGELECDVYLLGEAPGREEDKSGRPFVGLSGQYLTECIESSGLSNLRVRIGNTVRCRPPNNRKPTPLEVEACSFWTELELDMAKPKVIVALGQTAMSYFFPDHMFPKKAKVGDYVGKQLLTFHLPDSDQEIRVIGSYHPAARQLSQRLKIKEVLSSVAESLGVAKAEKEKFDYKLEVLW